MRINIPKKALYILDILKSSGYEAYIVGGCVRDSLLKKTPTDWDICTSCPPDNCMRIFLSVGIKSIPTGLSHGTITVLIDGDFFEITTFRIESDYMMHRKPSSVSFVSDIIKDLERRDFTINAMAYNPSSGLIDPFNGKTDLKNKIIRCVGNPNDRFNEDALRILRAFRFSSQLSFDIEKNTASAMISKKENIKSLSMERIKIEFEKILMSNPKILIDMHKSKVLELFIPEFCNSFELYDKSISHIYDLATTSILAIIDSDLDLEIRLAILFHALGKVDSNISDFKISNALEENYSRYSVLISQSILKKLRYDNITISTVSALVKYHNNYFKDKISIKKFLRKFPVELFPKLLNIQAVLMPDKINDTVSKSSDLFNEILKNKEPFLLKDLNINGNSLIMSGIPRGKHMRLILDSLLDIVIESPSMNTEDFLLSKAKEIYSLKFSN